MGKKTSKSGCTLPDLSNVPEELADRLLEGDRSLPDIRDLRKLARRLPRLRRVTWTGRGGKGSWDLSSTSAPLGDVSFTHAAISTLHTWHLCQQDPPDFEFEDEVADRVLEPVSPSAPTGQAEPSELSRTTTRDSSKTSLLTPASETSATLRSETSATTHSRRSSLAIAPEKGSTPLHGLKISTMEPGATKSRRHSLPAGKPASQRPTAPDSPLTPATSSGITSPWSRGGHSSKLLFQRPSGKPLAREEGEAVKNGGTTISDSLTRHVPRSARPAISPTKAPTKPPRNVVDTVPIVETDEDGWERFHVDGEDEEADRGGWTTVSPRDKVRGLGMRDTKGFAERRARVKGSKGGK